jgi:hypothetical protein
LVRGSSSILRPESAEYRAQNQQPRAVPLRRSPAAIARLPATGRAPRHTPRAFAGDPPDQARYYPEDTAFLLELTPTVDHYEFIALPDQAPG